MVLNYASALFAIEYVAFDSKHHSAAYKCVDLESHNGGITPPPPMASHFTRWVHLLTLDLHTLSTTITCISTHNLVLFVIVRY